jgi:hypothetical protein
MALCRAARASAVPSGLSGERAGREQAAEQGRDGGCRLALRPFAFGVGDAAHHQGDARVVEVERHLGHLVAGADRRTGDAQAGDRQPVLGPGGEIERDDAGVAGQRLEAVTLAPAGKGVPGRAIGAPCAGAGGAFGVARGVGREVGQARGNRRCVEPIAVAVRQQCPCVSIFLRDFS